MTNKQFDATYQVDDGFANNGTRHVRIDASEIDQHMEDRELSQLYYEIIEEDFAQNVCASPTNLEAFMEWARVVRDSAK